MSPSAEEEEEERRFRLWYDRKSALMEEVLGTEHDTVLHSAIPFFLGGGLDLYLYPNGEHATAVATKELTDNPEEGSKNAVFDLYEFVMFTKAPLVKADTLNDKTPFGAALSNINAILNPIARYSAEATLNPNETSEFPEDFPQIGGKCLIFDAYPSLAEEDEEEVREFGLMAIIEVFRSEMEYARENGGANLIALLKEAGHYPYSDLDREPVA